MDEDNQTPTDMTGAAPHPTTWPTGETPAPQHAAPPTPSPAPPAKPADTRSAAAAPADARPASFDQWLTGQDDYTRALITGHITGLKSALDSERSERKTLAKQLKDLSAKADEGSDLRAQMDRLTADFEAVNRRAAFYESAPADVTNLRLAWLAAQDGGYTTPDGKVDWGKLREQNPELFKRPAPPPGHAGSGAQQSGAADDRSMNAFIRAAAGKGQ